MDDDEWRRAFEEAEKDAGPDVLGEIVIAIIEVAEARSPGFRAELRAKLVERAEQLEARGERGDKAGAERLRQVMDAPLFTGTP